MLHDRLFRTEGSTRLCPSCGGVAETDPCPLCDAPLRPRPVPAALAALGALWFVAVLGVATGANILGGNSPAVNRASGVLFFLPLLLAAAVSLFWVPRLRKRGEPTEEAGED